MIPQRLLDPAEESPYGWAPWVWERLSAAARSAPPQATLEIARRLVGEHGSVLDVGAGKGRSSLPLAVSGHNLTAVESDAGMADGFEEDAARLVRGQWPDVAAQVPQVDVVVSASLAYDMADIGPLVAALEPPGHGVTA